MKKPPLQDVIVKNHEHARRSVRPPMQIADDESRSYRSTEAPTQRDYGQGTDSRAFPQSEDLAPRMVRPTHMMQPRTNKRWLYIALGIGAVVVLSYVALSLLFAGATVTVYPKQDTVVVNASFTAEKDAENGALHVEQIVLERTATRAVAALGEEEVEERSSGNITIYNEYSDTPQRLIKNTRFQSSNNLIYRIRESVEIPGKSQDGSPGSIEVKVFAEEPGESYNIGPDTFTIPGFAGLPQEEKVYAKSTSELSGGFVGVRRSVNEAERTETLKQLETQLRDELLATAFTSSDTPEGYHLFKESLFFEFNALPDETTDTDQVTLSLSGKLHGILFPEDEFAKRVAQVTLSTYNDSPLRIENLEDFTVSVTPKVREESEVQEEVGIGEADMGVETGTVDQPWLASAFTVSVQGKAHFIWEFDEKSLAQYFAGKDKDLLQAPSQNGVLEGYPGIDRLEVSIRPFWKGSFPESPEDILVITELDD